jgi:serine/threonine-protein kinase
MIGWGAASRWEASAGREAEPPVIRFSLHPPAGRELDVNLDIAPDGTAIVFDTLASGTGGVLGAESHVYLRRLDRTETTPLPVIDAVYKLAFSPDGQSVASVAETGISVTPLDGRPPIPVVTRRIESPQFLAWAGPDQFFVASFGQPIRRASPGTIEQVTVVDSRTEVDHHSPQPLPGGQALVFAIHDVRGRFSLAVQSLVSGERRPIVESGFHPRYLATGHLVYGRDTNIMAVPFDPKRGRIVGPLVTMIENVATDTRSGDGRFSVSQQGTLVYVPARRRDARQLVWVDRAGRESPLPISPRSFEMVRVAPDGRQIAFVSAENGRRDIWTYDIGSDRLARVTNDHDNWSPLWSSDGRVLVYASNRGDTSAVVQQPLDGSPARILGRSVNDLWPTSFGDDGRTVIVTEQPQLDRLSIAELSPAGGGTPTQLIQDASLPRWGRLSPDRRWLAYAALQSGRLQVFIRAYPGGPSRQVSVDGGTGPMWRADGRELYFRAGPRMHAVLVDPSGGLSWGKPVLLFEGPHMYLPLTYDAAPDGRFVMIRPDPRELAPQELSVVVNWARELRERAPAGSR